MRFAYCYLMIDDADRVRQVAPDHAACWRDLQFGGYEGGPFADRSGGLIVFAASVDHAGRLVGGDPFVRHGLLADRWANDGWPEADAAVGVSEPAARP